MHRETRDVRSVKLLDADALYPRHGSIQVETANRMFEKETNCEGHAPRQEHHRRWVSWADQQDMNEEDEQEFREHFDTPPRYFPSASRCAMC